MANLVVADLVVPSSNPTQLVADGTGDVFAEFPGYGVWEHSTATSWTQLTSSDASVLAVNSNGDKLFGVFSNGINQYLAGQSWSTLPGSTANVTTIAVDAAGDLFADLSGYGVQEYSGGVWTHSTTIDASLLTADANGDVFGEFPGFGVYEYKAATGWLRL